MREKKNVVFVCPLNWGLGHATRCIPLIYELLRQEKEVIIGGNGSSLTLLKKEFPDLKFIEVPGVEINYGEKNLIFNMLIQLPKMLMTVYREHKLLKTIVAENKIDLIISDNRYGLFHKNVKSIFITHQLYIQLPSSVKWLKGFVNRINHFFIRKFNEVWIPDVEGGKNLSGKLSHGNKKFNHARFIGMLSRFGDAKQMIQEKKYEVLVVLSGPEPQRTLLEEKLTNQLTGTNVTVLIVRGLPGSLQIKNSLSNITFVNHLSTIELKFYLRNSLYIICRSGYSSLMDLAVVGRSAVIIPTPGQTEQEYLAVYHHQLQHHFMQTQAQLNLKAALEEVKKCSPFLADGNLPKIFFASTISEHKV